MSFDHESDGIDGLDVLVVTNYAGAKNGGASRQAQALANALAADGYAVAFLCRTPVEGRSDPGPRVHQLEWGDSDGRSRHSTQYRLASAVAQLGRSGRSMAATPARWIVERLMPGALGRTALGETIIISLLRVALGEKERQLRSIITTLRPRVVVSFIVNANVLTSVACWNLPVRVVTSERAAPDSPERSDAWDALERFTRRRPAVLTGNSVPAVAAIEGGGVHARQEVLLAPNILRGVAGTSAADAQRLLFIGRLVALKRVDLLLEAFASLYPVASDWTLTVAGDGPELDELRARAHQLDISERVTFLGNVEDVPALLAGGGILVLPSSHEGTPNVLMEAMAHGLPSVVVAGAEGAEDLLLGGGRPARSPPAQPQPISRTRSHDSSRTRCCVANSVRAHGPVLRTSRGTTSA